MKNKKIELERERKIALISALALLAVRGGSNEIVNEGIVDVEYIDHDIETGLCYVN